MENYAKVEFQHLVPAEDVLTVDVLEKAIPAVRWRRIQGSGITVPVEEEEKLGDLWLEHLHDIGLDPLESPDEVVAPGRYVEGATRKISVNSYERNPAARRACIDHYGAGCSV
jgi:5-methylcytosine-specific restriction protein A